MSRKTRASGSSDSPPPQERTTLGLRMSSTITPGASCASVAMRFPFSLFHARRRRGFTGAEHGVVWGCQICRKLRVCSFAISRRKVNVFGGTEDCFRYEALGMLAPEIED